MILCSLYHISIILDYCILSCHVRFSKYTNAKSFFSFYFCGTDFMLSRVSCWSVAACLLLQLSVTMTANKAIEILREHRGGGAIQTVKVRDCFLSGVFWMFYPFLATDHFKTLAIDALLVSPLSNTTSFTSFGKGTRPTKQAESFPQSAPCLGDRRSSLQIMGQMQDKILSLIKLARLQLFSDCV